MFIVSIHSYLFMMWNNSDTIVSHNQYASACGNNQHVHEIWNWNSKANVTYAPETMSPTHQQANIRTRWIQYTPLQLPSTGV